MGYVAQKTRLIVTGRTSADEEGLLYQPDDYQRTNTKRGIVFLHGRQGGYRQGGSGSDQSAYENVITPILTALQLPILSINGGSNAAGVISAGAAAGNNITGGPDHWGNPVGVRSLLNNHTVHTATPADLTMSYRNLPAAFKATGGLILIGFSMGGVQAHNFAARNPTLVKAIVSIVPPMNLNDIFATNRNNYAAEMNLAYNGPIPNAPTKVSGTGTQSWDYKIVPILNTTALPMDGTSSPSGFNSTGALRAALGTTPNVMTWTFPAGGFNTSLDVLGYRIVRSLDNESTWETAGGTAHVQGAGVLSVGESGTVTSIRVNALPYAIQPSTTMLLVDHDWIQTQAVTVTAAGAAANATSIPVTSVALTRPFNYGARILPTRFSDAFNTAPPAYTPVSNPWTNAKNLVPSWDPALYFPAALQAIPHLMFWSANDTIVEAAASTPGTLGPNLDAYKTAYGANLDDEELNGDPTHGNAFTGFGTAQKAALLAFLANHL